MAKSLFISYSHADDELLERLHKHLAQLEREGSVAGWYDREIHAGGKIDTEIKEALERANIFIACASPDYIASNYCYERELDRALEREAAGELTIVPVIFEPCDWLNTPLAKFKAMPRDGKAISEYTNPNVALLEVITALRSLASHVSAVVRPVSEAPPAPATPSRYRIKKDFDDLDKRDFVERSFSEIYRFFEASVSEVQALPDIEARLSPLESDTFSCTVINRGIRRGFQTIHIRRGGSWGAIDYLFGEQNERNTSNGGFGLESDDYQLALRTTGFGSIRRMPSGRETITSTEAAQLMWDELLSKVGIDYA